LLSARVRALGELVRRWGQPVEAVMQRVGWDAEQHGRQRISSRCGGKSGTSRRLGAASAGILMGLAPFVCEHIQPRARGGGDTLEELAWSCAGCNGHKADKTRAVDPASGRLMPLFHPRRQNWARHFQWSGDGLLILGRTAVGRATIAALELNRAELVNLRQMLFLVGRHPPPGTAPR
jgi:hypothetical protein